MIFAIVAASPVSGSEVGLMQRRKFIAGLGVAAAWPIVAKAQERERIRRVSVLMNRVATDTESQSWLAAFIQGLRELGWTEGQNLRFDICWSASDTQLASNLCGAVDRAYAGRDPGQLYS